MKQASIYEKCKVWWWGGYYVKVRNSINYHLERRHLSDVEKELFEKVHIPAQSEHPILVKLYT